MRLAAAIVVSGLSGVASAATAADAGQAGITVVHGGSQPSVQGGARIKHWHGATSGTGMTHVALQETLDGNNVNWLEPVTDEQFRTP